MTYSYCEYGKHAIVRDTHGSYVIYSDQNRGLTDVVCCKACYGQHVLKYFPDSHVADYIRNNPSEYPIHNAPSCILYASQEPTA